MSGHMSNEVKDLPCHAVMGLKLRSYGVKTMKSDHVVLNTQWDDIVIQGQPFIDCPSCGIKSETSCNSS